MMQLIERNDSWGNWFEIETSDPTEIYMGMVMIDGVLYAVDGNYIAYQPEYELSDVMVRLTAVDSEEVNQLLADKFGAQYGKYPVGAVCHACEGTCRSTYDERRPCSVCDGEGVLCNE
jgi:hypothetical protein